MPGPTLRLGTRASKLALWQAEWVADQLRQRGTPVELVRVTTTGDVTSGPLGAVGGSGLFTKEIQRALLDGRIDLAVHSLKDLPTEAVPGLVLAAVPERESCRDVFICPAAACLEEISRGATVGTGSLRRKAQLLHQRPDLQVLDIRGNVETRLRKLDEGEFQAIVLAEAGLKRLGLADRITARFDPAQLLPAIGQGALGLETRADDTAARAAVAVLDDQPSHAAVLAERALLAALRGGCLAPVGAWARLAENQLLLDAVVLSADGRQRLATRQTGLPESAEECGLRAAAELLAQGAADLIAGARRN